MLKAFTAFMLAIPNAGIIWFVVLYPLYGITGGPVHPYFHVTTLLVATMFIWSWAYLDNDSTAEVVYRCCRLGAILSLLLPLITGMISLLWLMQAVYRPAEFLDSFNLFEIPALASAATIVLVLLFLLGSYLAARKLDGVPF
jgi:hypothetical protein